MFFDQELINSESFKNIWLTGHGQSILEEDAVQYESISSQILGKLNETRNKRRSRLSLRTSSVLVSGVARLYSRNTEKLLHDCSLLDEKMRTRIQKASSASNPLHKIPLQQVTYRENNLSNANCSNTSSERISRNTNINPEAREIAVQTENSYLSKTAGANPMCYIQVHDCNGQLKRLICCSANPDVLNMCDE